MTQSDLVKPPASAVSADASPQPDAPQQQIATPLSVAAPTAIAAVENDCAPASRPARGRGEPQRPASASRTTRSSAPRPSVPAPHADSVAPRPGPASAPLAPTSSARPESPASYLNEPPAPLPATAPSDVAPDDLAFEPAGYPPSRLSGLRNLLVTLGRRSLNQDAESTDTSVSGIEPRFERASLRPAYPDSTVSATAAPENGASTRLTTQPEFLPPRPSAELQKEKEKEKESVRPTPPRRENPEGDEIQTLPSWRGQYRKKRYPPI